MNKTLLVLLILCVCQVFADVYLQSGGSNNRLNEKSATRTENNRLFDSQNNARGGVNVGIKTTTTANVGLIALDKVYNVADTTDTQYPLSFYEGSELVLAWTNQHGCGGNPATDAHNSNCNIVLQYTCDTDNTKPPYNTDAGKALQIALSNGVNTNRPTAETNNYNNIATTTNNNNNNGRGRHENEQYYYECANRNRNKGLFTAGRNLKNNDARSTRQNENGNQSGLECPEERDYYPYWGPTPWRDIAYLTSEVYNQNTPLGDICKYVREESQNVKARYKCVGDATNANWNGITEDECSGTWKDVPAWGVAAPECKLSEWSRDNHLGNTREGHFSNYTWTLPSWSDLTTKHNFKVENGTYIKCVARIRYNITTSDYDPWNTDATSNADSPVKNNPTQTLGKDIQGLKLALNTAQTGRTFQDRTHIFTIRKKPAELNAPQTRIINLNVLGKRGNIVQTFPSIEYWFAPHTIRMTTKDFFHIQWTGSNTHNNGANGGDGQTGDDGQGQGGTDRNNFVLTYGESQSWPIALDKEADHMFKHAVCYVPNGTNLTRIDEWVDCAVILATSGYHRTAASVDGTLNNQMNNAPPSLVNGIIMKITKPGTYTYMSSRNNNFTNRSQKGVIIVE